MPKKIIQITIILIAVFAINVSLASLRADTYKKEGKESLKSSFPYLAVDKFNKALKLDSSDGEVRGYLGIAYTSVAERASNITEKKKFLEKAIYEVQNARKTYEDPSISYHLANIYELSGDIDKAIQEAIKSYNKIPSAQAKDKLIVLYKIKGDILLAKNRKDEAIKFYLKFVELKEVNVTNKDTTDYEFLRNLIPDNFFVRYCLAKLYINQGLWEKAVIELEYIKKLSIYNEDIMEKMVYTYYYVGRKYYNERKFKEAEQCLNLVIALDNINKFNYTTLSINLLSALYEDCGNIDKAVETLIKLEYIDTQKGQGYYQLGRLFDRKSNHQKAIEYFEKYLPFRPISDAGVFITLGDLYGQIGDIDRAVNSYKKLEDMNSFKWQGYYYIGLLYEKKERWVDALKEFEYALEVKPADSQILLKIGQLYEKIGNNKKALKAYRKAIAIDPKMAAELNFLIARLYEKMGERENAISLINRSRIAKK